MKDYVPPAVEADSFNCPFCDSYAQMQWYRVGLRNSGVHFFVDEWLYCRCVKCDEYSVWKTVIDNGFVSEDDSEMVYPIMVTSPKPNEDMPDDIRAIYEEARQVEPYSKRAAAALLRLCAEKLLHHLGNSGSLNDIIGELVKKGLPERIKNGLDIVRVTGNDAIHAVSEMRVDEKPEHVAFLFKLINLIVDNQITEPKDIQAAFNGLPDTKKAAIEKRDRHNREE